MYVQAETSVSGQWGLSMSGATLAFKVFLSMLVLTTTAHFGKLGGLLSR